MITARSLSKSFGRKPVLRDLSFCARAGEITLLIGPNGAGKTTTMRLLTGLAQPDGGTAAIAGRDIVRERIAAQQLLSYLPQNPSFHPRFTCGQIVEFYARANRCRPGERRNARLPAGLLWQRREPRSRRPQSEYRAPRRPPEPGHADALRFRRRPQSTVSPTGATARGRGATARCHPALPYRKRKEWRCCRARRGRSRRVPCGVARSGARSSPRVRQECKRHSSAHYGASRARLRDARRGPNRAAGACQRR